MNSPTNFPTKTPSNLPKNLGVGKEVLSFCNPCKHTLAHLILSMKDVNIIGKVQCKTCKAIHSYKDPSKVSARGSANGFKMSKARAQGLASKNGGHGSTGATGTVKNKKNASISDIWLHAVNNTHQKSQAYSIKTQYKQGDILDHPKFGPGVIDRLIDADKIEVIFRHEIKTLIHNK